MARTQLCQSYPENCRGRDFVLPPLRGCDSRLRAMLSLANVRADRGDRVFVLGDLFDQGAGANYILDLVEKGTLLPLRGNHEEIARFSLRGDLYSREAWRQMGNEWSESLSLEALLRFRNAIDEMPLAIELKLDGRKIGLIHAELPEGTHWDEVVRLEARALSRRRELAVARAMLYARHDAGKPSAPEGIDLLISGSRLPGAATPVWIDRRLWIDTGVYPSGSLSMVELNTMRAWTIPESGAAFGPYNLHQSLTWQAPQAPASAKNRSAGLH